MFTFMKTVFFILFFSLSQLTYCQVTYPSLPKDFVTEIFSLVTKQHDWHQQSVNIPPPGIKIPANLLLKPGSLKQLVNQLPIQKKIAAPKTNGISGLPSSTSCADTSYVHLLGIHNGWLYLRSVTPTQDGGMLVPLVMYDTTRLTNPWWRSYGILVKLDASGNVIWVKQFEELTPGNYSNYFMNKAFELPNHDIIFTGYLNNDGSSTVYNTPVFRLTSSGNIIWKNCLKTNIAIFNSPPGTFSFDVESAIEGFNGDIILCGTSNSNVSFGHIETVTRLNNLGQLVWDANYGNHGVDGSYRFGAEGAKIFLKNGQLVLVGLSHGCSIPQTPTAVNFFTLDYANGNLLSKRFFKPQYSDPTEEFLKSFTYYTNNVVLLNNGHILLYGKLFSDFLNMTTVKNHFGVIEFDTAFNFVNAYTLNSNLTTYYYNNRLYFDQTGKGLISVFQYVSGYQANIFFGAFNGSQFLNERKIHYTNTGIPGNNGFTFLNNNSYAYLQSYSVDSASPKSYFEFRKMHNSDTTSQCLGKDTTLFDFLPLHIVEDSAYLFWDPNDPNKLDALPLNISQTDTLSTSKINLCSQTNYCDTVKIHGNPVICGSSPVIFTAYKNSACGGIVQWGIANNAIDSLQILSDSSVRIWFKNINWQGKLYSSLPSGACYAPAQDSLAITIVSRQRLNLGPDTVICPGNTIILNAHSGFTSYLWQDGSTDSIYIVTQPGIYFVRTTNACGEILRDTVIVSPHPPIPFDIGPDQAICAGDTTTITATPGFINYVWQPNYRISSLAGQMVNVSPLVDTLYKVKAEKTPGCFAYDSLHVKVNPVPVIELGRDTSICRGDSIILDAGAGFVHYTWNTGDTTRKITLFNVGRYSVKVVNDKGCFTKDTMQILNVFSNPTVNLGNDSILCSGTTRTLDAGNFSNYTWSTGSTNRRIVANSTGLYIVIVSDTNNCMGKGSINISRLIQSPSTFLPPDTAVCSYGTIVIKSLYPYPQYMWKDGSTNNQITTSQPGLYWLQVKDTYQCVGRDTILVLTKDCMKGFYIPNAFTPNGDGKNDMFRPLIFGIVEQYEFTIFNRWGQPVFTSKELGKGWDGSVSGSNAEQGAFTWLCRFKLKNEVLSVRKGSVLLIK